MALAILSSGGDAAGMNPAIKKFVDYVYKMGEEPYLIYEGFEGLIDNKIKKALHRDVAGIVHLGGTIIRSSRSKRFLEYHYRKIAYENLKGHGITGLVVLGGDGSFRGMEQFSSEFDLDFVGIPSTIDNDIYGTEYCLRVDTALNVIRDAIDKIRDTASSFNRAFLVEVMGRNCGYLAIVSAMVSGAEVCVVPEMAFPFEREGKRLRQEVEQGRSYVLAVVSEGSHQTREVHQWIQETIGLETRVSILGHIQRGGNPSVRDRMMAFRFVIEAVDALLEGTQCCAMVGYNGGAFGMLPITEVAGNTYALPQELRDVVALLD